MPSRSSTKVTLGCRVWNMERASGYLAASIPELPPAELETLNSQAAREYVVAKGYSPDVLDARNAPDDTFVNSAHTLPMANSMAGLTISITRQGPSAAKVKLRFSDLYYPRLVEAYYNLVWAAVDKQIFFDRNID
jgi:hypothetical protein